MTVAAALLAFALSACNGAFGLVPTIGPDSDGDGRDDDNDNCPLVANSDQADRDNDTLGDACDPCEGPQTGTDHDRDGIDDGCDACLTGRNTDEDRDTYLDGCDACPGTSDDQSDDDGDAIGNACDADPSVQNHRVFFDGFDPPLTDWRAWLVTWEATGDGGFQPASNPGGGATGAWNPASAVTGNEFWVDAEIAVPTQPFSGVYVGLNLLTREQGSNPTNCWIAWDTGGWHAYDDFSQTIPLGATVRVRYRAHGGADECTFDGVQTPLFDLSLQPDTYVPGIATQRASPVRWIDVVSR